MENELTPEDKTVLLGLLRDLDKAGEPAYIPLGVDVDGDGHVDAWGLSEDKSEVILVSGINLENTTWEATGESDE